MMKKKVGMSLLLIGLVLSSGCSSTHYIITTKSGAAHVSSEEPEYNEETKAYSFEDLDKKNWTINREEIQSIEQKKQ